VRVALLKVSGVESVDVSLERATAAVRLRPGNGVALNRIREIVENNGFTAKEATVTVVGSLVDRDGKPALSVTGTNTAITLAADPKQPAAFTELSERPRGSASDLLELTGTVESRPGQTDVLFVRTATAAAR
jgi:copper chaperone CopZ